MLETPVSGLCSPAVIRPAAPKRRISRHQENPPYAGFDAPFRSCHPVPVRSAPLPHGGILEPITTTIEGAKAATGLGKTKLYELIKEGRLQTVKVGTRTLVKVDSLRDLVAA
ncbi:MAG: helix-turn-helix domain-containing protein [Novosphingobium sp.]